MYPESPGRWVEEVRRALDQRPLGIPFAPLSECRIGWRRVQQLFHRELRLSPRAYFERRRIAHARLRLADPATPVKEVASELGFRTLSHFSVWFKRHTGLAPRRFREATPADGP